LFQRQILRKSKKSLWKFRKDFKGRS
jgi:hypothetical protein